MSGNGDGLDRESIQEHLKTNPGARPSDVAKAFGVHPSTADYHLRRMEQEGRVARVQVGRELYHYPTGEGWCRDGRRIHARLTPAGRALVSLLLDRGLASRREVVGRGFSRSATRWAIDQMLDAGLLERSGWGIYELADDVEGCARAALRERPCSECNDVDQVARATSNPSPRGRIVASSRESSSTV